MRYWLSHSHMDFKAVDYWRSLDLRLFKIKGESRQSFQAI